jgi:hypothetical protein
MPSAAMIRKPPEMLHSWQVISCVTYEESVVDLWEPTAMSRREERNDESGERSEQAEGLRDRRDDADVQTEAGLPRDYWHACKLAEQR